MPELSVLIPARNEMFLNRTVDDVLSHARADTEVIVVLDGAWPDPGLPVNPCLHVIYHPQSVGQRAATNEAARISDARYVMKLDAHCSVAEDFDVELIRAAGELGEDVTQIPAQKNLHAFDWVCLRPCGWRQYQGPTPMVETTGPSGEKLSVRGCPKCGGEVDREIVWQPRSGTTTTAWRFDADLHFQYAGEMSKRPALQHGDFTETMSCLGACFFMSRARYWQLGGLDEGHGSWGQMGTEVGCKSWLSGGRMVTNRRTWFAHMFRTQGGDFSFPYEIHGRDQDRARKYSRELWKNDRWPGQKRPLSWLLEHFAPVPGWEDHKPVADVRSADVSPAMRPVPSGAGPAPLSKGVVYYSDCRGDQRIFEAVRTQLRRCVNGNSVVSVTLAPVDFGRNIVLPLERGYLTMFRQQLAGLEASDADIVFMAEHDILYHPSHFDFVPPRDDTFYYNVNTWKVCAISGHALHYVTKQVSGLCAYRKLLVEHYRERVRRVEEAGGYDRHMGFEPGCHGLPRGVDDHRAEEWWSAVPNVDIRHQFNLTRNRWRQDQFRDKNSCLGWTEAEEVPGWGRTKGRFVEWLEGVAQWQSPKS